MTKIVLLGGSGFIGKNIIKDLSHTYKIVVISRNIDELYLDNYKVKGYKLDINNTEALTSIILLEKPDIIINLISFVTASRDLSLLDEMLSKNLTISNNIFSSIKDYKQLKLFIHIGSAEEYGNIEAPFSETKREYPNSPYALAKQLTTNYFLMLNRLYDFPVTILRLSNLFGCYQPNNKFIPDLIKSLKKNEEFDTTDGKQHRDFLYTKNFTNILSKVMSYKKEMIGNIINIGSGTSVELREVITYVKNIFNSDSVVNYGAIQKRANEPDNFINDVSKLELLIGEKIQFNILNDIEDFIKES